MSARALAWVWEHSSSGGVDRLVLLAIADCAGDDGGNAWPTIGSLAAKARVSPRTVQRAIRVLQLLGELTVDVSAGAGGANMYALPMPATPPVNLSPPRQVDTPPVRLSPPPTPAVTPPDRLTPPGVTTPVNVTPPLDSVSGLNPKNLRTKDLKPKTIVSAVDKNGADEDVDLEPRPDVDALCILLADRIEANGSKRPTITDRWRQAARLMLDRDGRTPEQVRAAIDWSQDDEFWRVNILSMPKLRQKFDQLRLAAARGSPQRVATTAARVGAALARADAYDRLELE